MTALYERAAANLNLPPRSVQATAQLLAMGATVPFISRYRKEHTGGLDETAVRAIETELQRLEQLDLRREAILESIGTQGKLTDELRARIAEAPTATALEDLYLPYRPKRRTRATVARERGLEPLAKMLMSAAGVADPLLVARRFCGSDEVPDEATAIAGAKDIIAEWLSESVGARNTLRGIMRRQARVKASIAAGKENEPDAAKYRTYASYSHPLRNIASHNYLALRRGQAEGLLKVSVTLPDEDAAVAAVARDTGLAGYEFASGIPGTVGGAAIMNAGAYEGQFSDVAVEVRCLVPDGNSWSIVSVPAAEANWGYRTSRMMREGWVVLGATLQLRADSPAAIAARMEELRERRESKQPLEMPSAGSTFKRPEGHFAGALIQEAGCQGLRVGGAQVSEKHAGFVVNTGDATAADVLALIAEVQRRVRQTTGVELEPEVRLWQ